MIRFLRDKNFSKNQLRKHMQAISLEALAYLATEER